MKCLDDFRLTLNNRNFLPLMVGGMGTNISTSSLVLAIEKLGGIAHLSDAMLPDVADREIGTTCTHDKTVRFKHLRDSTDKSEMSFDLKRLGEVTRDYVRSVMQKATGKGLVLINCMEKLTMNDSVATLRARLNAALDAGIDGITLSAGLHLSSFKLIADNPRFHEALLGIVVSSARALNLFLKRTASVGRVPDYVIVEGPLAGGHLGFGEDWKNFKLEDIVKEVKSLLSSLNLKVPVIAAGGVFTGGEAVRLIQEAGADGLQVATRFAIAQESGLPEVAKTAYLNSVESDIVVNHASPTGYLMRMLKQSPALTLRIKPNCESYGYILSRGQCSYLQQFNSGEQPQDGKCCLCTHMRNYKVWTCGALAHRLKETTTRRSDGTWYLPSAAQIWEDYRFSTGGEIRQAQILD